MSNNNKESLRVRTANLEKELKALREKVDRLDESRGELRKIREENKKRNANAAGPSNKGASTGNATGSSTGSPNNGASTGPSTGSPNNSEKKKDPLNQLGGGRKRKSKSPVRMPRKKESLVKLSKDDLVKLAKKQGLRLTRKEGGYYSKKELVTKLKRKM
jgi:hypothetical protein